ncbi:hypothetical protein DHEL01_v206661 [Diaporthe helianthi]|uniref:ATPase AAA-type core domain-containing protein n=1 Tax=Diaporthe helianthi TaxID=158607 RepID=A0A2P5HXH0_DIAHE|nr:hypothetical protein DHEL01_v206661 [Diaporthe helianthi]
MFAYSLWDRKFVQLDSHFVSSRSREGQEGQSFQQLQIEQRSKEMIESLLYNHFNDMEAEKAGVVVESQDIIRGKGLGVSISLHGKPGVVFLRMLEYYNGILFLTTNRTGVLDEAIKSRIHLHLGFDDLNEHQTVEIFKNNIGRCLGL